MNSVLHTSSAYAVTEIDLTFQKETHSNSNISKLENKEKELYNKFGVETYKQFQEKIKQLLNGDDRAVIQNFTPEKLSNSIKEYTLQSSGIYEPNARFVFDLTNLETASKQLSKTFKTGLSVKNEYLESTVIVEDLNLNMDDRELRKVIEKIFKGHKYRTEKNWSEYLNHFIKALSETDVLTIYGKNNKTEEYTVPLEFAKIPNFPWGIMKKDVELAEQLGSDSELFQEMIKAIKSIYNFIFNVLGNGKSETLNKAMKNVWHRHFKKYENNPALFFHGTKTSNFISAVQGALGEFQSAVIFEYLGLLINDPAMAKILGNTYKNNELLRTDVQVFNKIGIQVKNFTSVLNNNDLGFIDGRSIDSTIHPINFSEYLDDKVNFLDFLANYFFNTDYQKEAAMDFEKLITDLGEYLGELMNMSMNDSLDDTFCFYLVSGKYLVPGSEILKMAEKIDLKKSVNITSSYRGLPDLAYEMPLLMRKNGKRRPLYTEYWRKNNKEWKPTDENRQVYSNLVNKNISIRTNFDLIKQIEQYALF